MESFLMVSCPKIRNHTAKLAKYNHTMLTKTNVWNTNSSVLYEFYPKHVKNDAQRMRKKKKYGKVVVDICVLQKVFVILWAFFP